MTPWTITLLEEQLKDLNWLVWYESNSDSATQLSKTASSISVSVIDRSAKKDSWKAGKRTHQLLHLIIYWKLLGQFLVVFQLKVSLFGFPEFLSINTLITEQILQYLTSTENNSFCSWQMLTLIRNRILFSICSIEKFIGRRNFGTRKQLLLYLTTYETLISKDFLNFAQTL